MKFKKLIALCLFATISQSYAYEGHGFKIISEHFTGTKGSGMIELAPKKMPQFVGANASTIDVNGRPTQSVAVKSWHDISIGNYTHDRQRYTYTFDLLCGDAHGHYERTIELDPHGDFTDSSENYVTVQENREGSYAIKAATQISGAENTFKDAGAVLRIRN